MQRAADVLEEAAQEVEESWHRADHRYDMDRWARALTNLTTARLHYVDARIAMETRVALESRP